MGRKWADILYVEDNEDYIPFVKNAMRKVDTSLHFGVIVGGKEAHELFDQAMTTRLAPADPLRH